MFGYDDSVLPKVWHCEPKASSVRERLALYLVFMCSLT